MKVRITWINENPGASRDECGYWRSVEGRFHIAPRYRHTINPDSYQVYDRFKNTNATHDTVREAKNWAVCTVKGELERDGVVI